MLLNRNVALNASYAAQQIIQQYIYIYIPLINNSTKHIKYTTHSRSEKQFYTLNGLGFT